MQPINWPRRRRLSFIMNFLRTPRSRSEPTGTEPWHQFTDRGTENFSSIENLFFPILRAEIWHPLIGHRTADLSSVEILFFATPRRRSEPRYSPYPSAPTPGIFPALKPFCCTPQS